MPVSISASTVAPGFEPVVDAFAAAIAGDRRGAAFCAWHGDRCVVDVHGGDRADDVPWEHDTVAVIASGTKGIVATAMLILIERGQLALDAQVASVWPEFAAAGKEDVLVRHVVSHTAGLPGVRERLDASAVLEPERIAAALAAQAPITAVGEPTYHALTYGWLCGEIVRRVDGRTVGRFVADEIAGPLGLDLSIGSPPDRIGHAADVVRSADYALSAFLVEDPDPRLDMVYGNPPVIEQMRRPEVMAAEIPGANALATAPAMARLYACLVAGGALDGVRIVQPSTIELARRELSAGADVLTGRMLRFGVGFELNPNPSCLGAPIDAFGHTGAGGSTHGGWPAAQVAFSFTMGEMRPESNDGRARRILASLHGCVS